MKPFGTRLNVEVLEGRAVPSAVTWHHHTPDQHHHTPDQHHHTPARVATHEHPTHAVHQVHPTQETQETQPAHPTPLTHPTHPIHQGHSHHPTHHSQSHHHHPAIPGAAHPQSKHPEVQSGIYVCDLQDGSTSTGFHFVGTNWVAGLGRVDVLATVVGVGFDAGTASGQATFSNAFGSVTVNLNGPIQAALSVIPGQFQYQVVSSTGAFNAFKDRGEIIWPGRPTLSRFATAFVLSRPVRS